MFTLDTSTEYGARIADRLQRETLIWLTTVNADGTPQPSPVWFLWTGAEFLIFSQPNKPKLRNIARGPRVALNFHGNATGGDIVIFTGRARLEDVTPTAAELETYDRKYAAGMEGLGASAEQFHQEYSVPLRVTPEKVRGF